MQLRGRARPVAAPPAAHGQRQLGAEHLRQLRCALHVLHHEHAGHLDATLPAGGVARRLHHEMDQLGEISRLVVGPYCDVYPSTEVVHGVSHASRSRSCPTRSKVSCSSRRALTFSATRNSPAPAHEDRDLALLARRSHVGPHRAGRGEPRAATGHAPRTRVERDLHDDAARALDPGPERRGHARHACRPVDRDTGDPYPRGFPEYLGRARRAASA